MKRKSIIVTAVVAALLIVSGTVFAARHGGMMRAHVLGFVDDALTKNPLSAPQKQAIEAVVDKTMAQFKENKADRQTAMNEGLELFKADTLDTAALQKLHADRVEHMSATLIPALTEVHDILTPAQRAELVQAVRDHHAQGGHGFWGP